MLHRLLWREMRHWYEIEHIYIYRYRLGLSDHTNIPIPSIHPSSLLLGLPDRNPAGYYAVRVIFTFVFGIASAVSIFALKVLYTDSSRYIPTSIMYYTETSTPLTVSSSYYDSYSSYSSTVLASSFKINQILPLYISTQEGLPSRSLPYSVSVCEIYSCILFSSLLFSNTPFVSFLPFLSFIHL